MLPLVKAKYIARACGAASFSEPSSNGNYQIAVPCEVTQGEHVGETITWIAAFHGTPDKNGMTGVDRIVESLQFMGFQGDDISELTGISDDAARALLPEEIEIVCEPDTFDGNTKLKVKWVNKLGAGRFAFKAALAGNELKQFSAQMKGAFRNARGGGAQQRTAKLSPNGNAPKQAPHPNAPGVDDSDIPF